MRKAVQRAGLALAAMLAIMLLSGCSGLPRFSASPQDLYSLPALPANYTELNSRINEILGSGAEYAAPTAGTNIQSVQMVDLDGDGGEEALAFFRNSGDEKPMKIYVFSARGDTYEQTGLIEGSGTAIYSIDYKDLDGDGRYFMEVYAAPSDCDEIAMRNCRNIHPDTVGHRLICVRVAR